MMRNARLVALLAPLALVAGCRSAAPSAAVGAPASGAPALVAAGGARALRLPLRFEENRGQFDARVRFVARQGGLTLQLTDAGSVMVLRKASRPADARTHTRADVVPPATAAALLEMSVHDGRPAAEVIGGRRLLTQSNYFIGRDPSRWRTHVANFAEVRYRDVRPGVDLVYHSSSKGLLEYDFVVAPGASPDVSLDVKGASDLRVAADGYLEIRVGGEVLRQPPPTVYQMVDGQRRELAGRYRVVDHARIGFVVARYDRKRTLVIDPVLRYATYLGGSGEDQILGVALDSSGAYITGYTQSANFPVSHALDPTLSGQDGFIAKVTPNGDALVYSTYFGGSGSEGGRAIAVDASGAAYVAGFTNSTNFPLVRPLFATYGGGWDGYVAKLSPTGDALVYSTYLGGEDMDAPRAIAVDGSGAAYVGGYTYSLHFPVLNAYQPNKPRTDVSAENGFVSKLSAAGDALVYSTYFGGNGGEQIWGIAVDASGAAYLGGFTYSTNLPTANGAQKTLGGSDDAFVAKLTPAGNDVGYATYVGGSSTEFGRSLTVDSTGAAYIVGDTRSSDFPTVSPLQSRLLGDYDGFITKLTPAGDAFAFSTFFGGSDIDECDAVAVDASGTVYVAGTTISADFPIANGAARTARGFDLFVAKLIASGSALSYSTVIGGQNYDGPNAIAVDANGSVVVGGVTQATDLPVSHPIQSQYGGGLYDGLLLRVDPDAPAPLSLAPTTPTVAPRAIQVFIASGGSGGYRWSLTGNASGATLDATGRYQAGTTPNVDDQVTVTDSAGGSLSATVHVGPALTVSPTMTLVPPRGSQRFVAAGGSTRAAYTWKLGSNPSGTIDGGGLYLAGTSPNRSDTITVSDAVGNSATATVTITDGVSITPANPATPPRGRIQFAAKGGSGTGFRWTLDSSTGGSIDSFSGSYQAGGTGNTTDYLTVQDSLGNVGWLSISVGGGLAVNPPTNDTTPSGTVQLTATGGSGSNYTWTVSSNKSGATIDASGKYHAGQIGAVADTVRASDALGNYGTATINVGASLAITPASPVAPPRGKLSFAASGGSGAGYTWTLTSHPSGGAIDANGNYTAGTVGEVSDTVQLNDSLGNVAQATVTVSSRLLITSSTAAVPPRGTLALVASGGSGAGYMWALTASPSGAMVDPLTGRYTAGSVGNVTDRVSVADPLGNHATLDITVGAGVSITPASSSLRPGDTVDFRAVGGSGGGYLWTLVARGSEGRIDSAGHYVAGMQTGNDIVHVDDSLGNSAEQTVHVMTAGSGSGGSDGGIGGGPTAGNGGGCGCSIGAARNQEALAPSLMATALLLALALWRRRAHAR